MKTQDALICDECGQLRDWPPTDPRFTAFVDRHSQAVQVCDDLARSYAQDHALGIGERDEELVQLIATARLQVVLQSARPRLSEMLSLDDWGLLLSVVQLSDLLDARSVLRLPALLAGDLQGAATGQGDALVEGLVTKLRDLDAVERLALVDTLEQLLQRCAKQGRGRLAVLESLGITPSS